MNKHISKLLRMHPICVMLFFLVLDALIFYLTQNISVEVRLLMYWIIVVVQQVLPLSAIYYLSFRSNQNKILSSISIILMSITAVMVVVFAANGTNIQVNNALSMTYIAFIQLPIASYIMRQINIRYNCNLGHASFNNWLYFMILPFGYYFLQLQFNRIHQEIIKEKPQDILL